MTLTRRQLALLASVLLLGAVMALWIQSRAASAHTGDLGWIWVSTSYADHGVDDDTTTLFQTEVAAAISDWDSSTSLPTHASSTGDIQILQVTAGLSGYYARAYVYSGIYDCVTGGCNKTNAKADWAVIRLNSQQFGGDWDSAGSQLYQKQSTIVHEFGHVYGLSHASCGDSAVMSSSGCWQPYFQPPNNGLVVHDLTHVDDLY